MRSRQFGTCSSRFNPISSNLETFVRYSWPVLKPSRKAGIPHVASCSHRHTVSILSRMSTISPDPILQIGKNRLNSRPCHDLATAFQRILRTGAGLYYGLKADLSRIATIWHDLSGLHHGVFTTTSRLIQNYRECATVYHVFWRLYDGLPPTIPNVSMMSLRLFTIASRLVKNKS
jgi:hypothetical protein